MIVLDGESLETALADHPASAVTIGVFDGVHRGHLEVLRQLKERAGELPTAVLTFRSHPATVLAPDRVPPALVTLRQRLKLLEAAGLDYVVLLDFDEGLSRLTPEEFVARFLVRGLRASCVVVGAGFRFGRGASGTVDLLQHLGDRFGFEVVAVPVVGGDQPVRSTEIRRALAGGDVTAAADLLGRPFALCGEVTVGSGRGHSIGVPTANLALAAGLAIPAWGVYAGRALLEDEHWPAAINVGIRPTFGEEGEVVEAHLLGYEGDLYGQQLCVEFLARLRDEMRFDDVGELVSQIERDIAATRRMVSIRRS